MKLRTAFKSMALATALVAGAWAITPPERVAVTQIDDVIGVFWAPVDGATQYQIYRDGNRVADLQAVHTHWLDTDVAEGLRYSYQVTAVTMTDHRLNVSELSEPQTVLMQGPSI